MHEYGITETIIKIIADEAEKNGYKKINSVNIALGRLKGFSGESIKFYFDILRDNTVLSNAELNIIYKNIMLKCPECGIQKESDTLFYKCSCGFDGKMTAAGGDEFYIESIEAE